MKYIHTEDQSAERKKRWRDAIKKVKKATLDQAIDLCRRVRTIYAESHFATRPGWREWQRFDMRHNDQAGNDFDESRLYNGAGEHAWRHHR